MKQSREKLVRGRVTKEVKWLRWIPVQCPNVAIRHDPQLKRFYPRSRRKGHNIDIVTTDKKKLVYIHHVPRKEERYNPNYI